MKLMDRNVTGNFVRLLASWYSKLFCSVKWGNSFSNTFSLCQGVRQGGILSPVLFAVFVNSILTKLEKSNSGCYLKTIYFNSFMYADDLLLLAISLSDMQKLIDICAKECKEIGMEINSKKSACMRIGLRHNCNARSLTINGTVLPWKNEIRYLGIIINSSKHFTFNIQCVKHKFFRALNGIFGKVNLNTSVEVLCSLIYTYCIPILLYGCESLSWNAKQISSIENACTQAFGKMLKTFDKNSLWKVNFSWDVYL